MKTQAGSQETWVLFPGFDMDLYMTLNKTPESSVPHYLNCKNGANNDSPMCSAFWDNQIKGTL